MQNILLLTILMQKTKKSNHELPKSYNLHFLVLNFLEEEEEEIHNKMQIIIDLM